MASITDLCGLVITIILLKLSAKMVIRCRSVCQRWRDISRNGMIPDPYDDTNNNFVHFDFARSRLRWLTLHRLHNPLLLLDLNMTPDLESRHFVLGPTVKGLCLFKDDEIYGRVGGGVIINPVTLEYLMLPAPSSNMKHEVFFGIGCCDDTNVIKVIRVLQRDSNGMRNLLNADDVSADVYCVGTGEWRPVVVSPFVFDKQSFAVFYNQRCHFINVGASNPLCVFDCQTEQFLNFPSTPAQISEKLEEHGVVLSIIHGNLCELYCTARTVSIWRMSRYGDGNSWERSISLDRAHLFPCENYRLVADFEIFVCTETSYLICRDSGTFSVFCPPLGRTIFSNHYFHCGGRWGAKAFHPGHLLLSALEPNRARKLVVE